MGTISVVAHEMTHVLGLNHEDRRCAKMNTPAVVELQPAERRLAVPLPDPRDRRRARPRPPLRRAREQHRAGAVRGRAGPPPPLGPTAAQDGHRHGHGQLDRGPRAARARRGSAQGRGLPDRIGDTTATLIARLESGPGQVKSIPDQPRGRGLLRDRRARAARAAWGRRHGHAQLYLGPRANSARPGRRAEGRRVRFTDPSIDRDGPSPPGAGLRRQDLDRANPVELLRARRHLHGHAHRHRQHGPANTVTPRVTVQGGSNRGTIAH